VRTNFPMAPPEAAVTIRASHASTFHQVWALD
jgi:hypothetical protein